MIEEGDEHLTAVQQVLCTSLLIPPLTGSTHLTLSSHKNPQQHGDVLWGHHDACQANVQGNPSVHRGDTNPTNRFEHVVVVQRLERFAKE